MEKFVGSWELIPEKTENAEAFFDKTNFPEEHRKKRREIIPIINISIDGDTVVFTLTPKGAPKPLFEILIKLGVPVDYFPPGEGKITGLFEMKDGRFYEKHKAVSGDLVREYDAGAYIEGDSMVREYSKGGVCMKNVYKRI